MAVKKSCSKRPRSAEAAERRAQRRMAVSVETMLLERSGAPDLRGFRQAMPMSQHEVPLWGEGGGVDNGMFSTEGVRHDAFGGGCRRAGCAEHPAVSLGPSVWPRTQRQGLKHDIECFLSMRLQSQVLARMASTSASPPSSPPSEPPAPQFSPPPPPPPPRREQRVPDAALAGELVAAILRLHR